LQAIQKHIGHTYNPMDTCYLFTNYLDEQGCSSLKVDSDGNLIAPNDMRSFAQIKTIQSNSRTILIETTLNARILTLDMPWLPERKARMAIPYALEEQLAQPVESLHFAFDKQRHQNNRYIIAVISKIRIQWIVNLLQLNNIEFDILTLDWFALSPQESCVTDTCLLLNTDTFKGALSEELARIYKNKHPLDTPFLFKDSVAIGYEESISPSDESASFWLVKRINKMKPMNLCQGSMQQSTKGNWVKKGYQYAGILCGVWLLSILLVNAIHLFIINKQSKSLDAEIAIIYHQFFPDAKQVISPKFRISQLLGTNTQDAQTFWYLLNQLAKAMKKSSLTTERLRFQNKTLFVTLLSNDFAALEQLENKLKELHISVKQTEASTKDKQVTATLELT
jgi:general secretion pathway protein L